MQRVTKLFPEKQNDNQQTSTTNCKYIKESIYLKHRVEEQKYKCRARL